MNSEIRGGLQRAAIQNNVEFGVFSQQDSIRASLFQPDMSSIRYRRTISAKRSCCSQVATTSATLECVCSEAAAVDRIAEAVAANNHLAANRTPELYREIQKAWEPIDQPKLVIDTDENLESCVDRAVRYLTAQTFVG